MRLPDDPIVLELLPVFCEEWEHNFDEDWWPRVRTSRDVEGLRHLGHTVVGSFAQFGLPDGAVLGQALMDRAGAGDWDAAERLLEALRAVVRDVRSALAARR